MTSWVLRINNATSGCSKTLGTNPVYHLRSPAPPPIPSPHPKCSFTSFKAQGSGNCYPSLHSVWIPSKCYAPWNDCCPSFYLKAGTKATTSLKALLGKGACTRPQMEPSVGRWHAPTTYGLQDTWGRTSKQGADWSAQTTARTVSAGQCGHCVITCDPTRNKHPRVDHNERKMRGWQEALGFNFLTLYTLGVCACMCISAGVRTRMYFL